MDVTHTNRHVSNNEKPGLLENNSRESRREMPSVGGRTKLQLLWHSLRLYLVNRAAAVPPLCPLHPADVFSDNLSAIMSSGGDTSQSHLTHFFCYGTKDGSAKTHGSNACVSRHPSIQLCGLCICIEQRDGRHAIPGALFSIQVQEWALIYKGWNGTRPVSERSPVGSAFAVLTEFRVNTWMLKGSMLCSLHVRPHMLGGDPIKKSRGRYSA